MTTSTADRFADFDSIDLAALNSKAEMLARIDNKYIISSRVLNAAIESFGEHFDVLDIEGKRGFSYSTLYFDDAERRCYYDHHQRRRKRCKVRIRSYVDARLNYLEVKLNDKRGTTLKKRLKIDAPLVALNDGCRSFIETCNRDVYGESFRKKLIGVIRIDYERYTLVAKEGGERMTIDGHMFFTGGPQNCTPSDNMYIVETKSARGNGIADKILRALHVQPTKRVSKYCIGLAATGQVIRHNGFLPALRRLQLVDQMVEQSDVLQKAGGA